MAKKKKKSKASREKRIAKKKARRASRKGKMPAGLRKYWAKKKAKVGSNPKPRRRSRKARMHRRRSKIRRRTRNVFASKGARIVVRRVKVGAVRKPSRKQRRRAKRVGVVGVNAGALSLTGGITGFLENAKATMKDGVKGFAFAFGGAAVSVAGGAFTSQITGNIIGRFAPSLLTNPIVSRILGAVNYYLPGWAAAKFIPGLSGKSRRAMLTGAAAAALLEVVKPGMIRGALQRVPVIGGLMGMAEDQAADLGAYVGYALSGTGDSHAGGVVADDTRDLSDYVLTGGSDAAHNMGVADYVEMAG